MSTSSARIVVVGAGPRPSGLLERLGANAQELAGRHLRIDLVDPCTPGAGRIWNAHESPLLLMNSRAMDVTMFTDADSSVVGPVNSGPSLAEWAEGIREGTIEAPTAGTERLAEIHAITPGSFPSRRVQALYLEWVFGRVLSGLPASIEVQVHRRSAVGLARGPRATGPAAGRGGDGPWIVALDDGTALEAELVLVTVGHTDAEPTPAQRELQDFASLHGGFYAAPSHADGVDLSRLPAGQDVILRGMGLGAVDLISLLTQGRGGSFSPDPRPGDPDRLAYAATGEEPVLWLGSRRGTPFHSKVRGEDVPAGPTELAHLTPEALDAAQDEHGQVDFETSVLPLVAAEIRHAGPGIALGGTDRGGWDLLTALDDPLVGLFDAEGPLTGEDALRRTREILVGHIEKDLRERTGEDPQQARALFQVLLRITGALARLLPAERLSPASRGSYPGLWHSLFSFVCSGPPPHRLQQLLALERAGVLHFLGPRLRVTPNPATGLFRAEAAGGARIEAPVLVDAFLPAPTLEGSSNSFLRLLGTEFGASDPHAPGRLRTDGAGRVLDGAGESVPGLWAVGPATSEFPLGAFARPHTDAPVFRRNDALARDLLAAISALPRPAGDADAAAASPSATSPAPPPVRDLGIVGAGKIGTAIARQAVRCGLHVHVQSSRDPRAVLARIPGAVPAPSRPADGDVVVLTTPFHAVFDLDPEQLRGAVVVDATNPWGEQDLAAIESARARFGAELTSSQLVAAHLHASRVAKALNHIGYHDVEDQVRPSGAADRRALAVASDDPAAAAEVVHLLDRLGFDAVVVDGLTQAHHLEPDGAVFGSLASREVLTAALQAADAELLGAPVPTAA